MSPYCRKHALLLAQNSAEYIKVALKNACIDEENKSVCKAHWLLELWSFP